MVYHGFFYAKSFNGAQTYCQSRVNGGNLASFINQDEIEAIIKVLPRSRIAWTGLCCKNCPNPGALSMERIEHSPCRCFKVLHVPQVHV